ncbi:YdbC family protein [Sedimentibacter sp. MB31-C6]|uniref:YdbC family protein n=1 Tax=Sedimentibacter sp. MB31-C6 TaxID=3109366 RepID=UPI002DDCB85F|nr:PC4/YdbC family ssDNA-binding protein [Sedimentibacter sp. MB36-C1]WSI04006.1 PC4/YdbC family ssDNA-binding protein [Sedimentibacter sp. MB36-C1]
MAELKYEITQEIIVISESSQGWTKELNLVSWNEREPKYDIREWSPEHDKMGKGITFTKEEMKKLRDALNDLDF